MPGQAGSVPALALREIHLSYGENVALDGASLRVERGEIHALLGENGAGKSTLLGVASGSLRPASGTVERSGRAVPLRSPADARAAGIALVRQHDLLVEAATVAENLALLDPFAPRVEGRRSRLERVARAAGLLGLDLPGPDEPAGSLPVGARQRVGIAGALLSRPEVLALDEPTAVLSPDESAALFSALRRLAAGGTSVVLVTHRVGEVFDVADRLTLLARGRTVLEAAVSSIRPEAVASQLLGASSLSAPGPGAPRAGGSAGASPATEPPVALRLRGFRPEGSSAPPVDLDLARGEVLVLLSIEGNGADRFATAVAGLAPFEGSVELEGRAVRSGRPGDFRAAGGAFIPEDRTTEGVFPGLTLEENLALGRGAFPFLLGPSRIREAARGLLASFDVRGPGAGERAGTLSGGNQQKLVLARELARPARLLVAVNPARGLDLASQAAILGRIASAAASSSATAVLVVTSDPDEARTLGGVVRVVYRGELSGQLPFDAEPADLSRLMSGVGRSAPGSAGA